MGVGGCLSTPLAPCWDVSSSPTRRGAWVSSGCYRPLHSHLLLPSDLLSVGKAACPWQGPIKPLEHTVAQGLEVTAAGGP